MRYVLRSSQSITKEVDGVVAKVEQGQYMAIMTWRRNLTSIIG